MRGKRIQQPKQSRARSERGFVDHEQTPLYNRAKKSLGQNFLNSAGALNKIIQAGNLTPRDTVLEIGPGRGALTRKLLDTGATVIAIEKDHELIPVLEQTFATEIKKKKFVLIEGDILDQSHSGPHLQKKGNKTTQSKKIDETSKFLEGWRGSGERNLACEEIFLGRRSYKVIANIPYYITGEIIRLFLGAQNKPSIIVFLVQKEVAERIVCRDGKKSILSLSVKLYGTPRYIATVPRGAFTPSPKVDSAIIQIQLDANQTLDKNQETAFFTLVKAGFSSKRKKAFSNILPLTDKDTLERAFTELELDQNIRPERIPLDKWLLLTQYLLL
jgi:16S rRNA (adenine1518-N6/adenine1519-N6)-dimethyltransferase